MTAAAVLAAAAVWAAGATRCSLRARLAAPALACSHPPPARAAEPARASSWAAGIAEQAPARHRHHSGRGAPWSARSTCSSTISSHVIHRAQVERTPGGRRLWRGIQRLCSEPPVGARLWSERRFSADARDNATPLSAAPVLHPWHEPARGRPLSALAPHITDAPQLVPRRRRAQEHTSSSTHQPSHRRCSLPRMSPLFARVLLVVLPASSVALLGGVVRPLSSTPTLAAARSAVAAPRTTGARMALAGKGVPLTGQTLQAALKFRCDT